MKEASTKLNFFLNLSKVQAVMTRTFESRLGGIGYSEFMILYYLSQARDEKMRRIDLANKIGLTASGITRLLLPMEKIGYIKREAHAKDARVSYVMLASGGKERLYDRLDDAELLADDLIPDKSNKKLGELLELLTDIGKAMVY